MNDENESENDEVSISMEITGTYDDVVAKLRPVESERAAIQPFIHDVEILLDTIDRMGGGTRSAIAEELPSDMIVSYDAQAVVDTLQVLERYDLVVLEGNTWKPGPKLQ